jgi:hypothetical protein
MTSLTSFLLTQLEASASSTSKEAEVEYHGKTFPGYNKPIASDKKDKKMMVLAKKGDEVKLVHFGQKGYQHNYSSEAKQNYLTRSAGIRNKSGELTKDDPFSPNYWARKVLWPKGKTGEGHNGPVKTEVRVQNKEAGLPAGKPWNMEGEKKASLLSTLINRKDDEKLAMALKLAEESHGIGSDVAEVAGLGMLAAPYIAHGLAHRPGMIGNAARAVDRTIGHNSPHGGKWEVAGLGVLGVPSAMRIGKWAKGKIQKARADESK